MRRAINPQSARFVERDHVAAIRFDAPRPLAGFEQYPQRRAVAEHAAEPPPPWLAASLRLERVNHWWEHTLQLKDSQPLLSSPLLRDQMKGPSLDVVR
jgi:hypothetical protein